MRPIESILLLANLLTFIALAVPLPRAVSWMRHFAPITLLIAFAQLLVEGPRWQMVPAYALAALFFVIWLLRIVAPVGKPARIVLRMSVGLVVLGLAVSIVLPVLLPVFIFSSPSGPYKIGTVTYHWVAANRQEVFSADPNARRELMVQIWYPAKKESSSPRAPYIQDADVVAPALAQLHQFSRFLLKIPQIRYYECC